MQQAEFDNEAIKLCFECAGTAGTVEVGVGHNRRTNGYINDAREMLSYHGIQKDVPYSFNEIEYINKMPIYKLKSISVELMKETVEKLV
ncbi:hypothetical protein ERX37_00120 [Macrococcus hajekii]|uniref:Uncharacterized protein n=1 Tax=Macrococcus hajekii TaxID=198482 RepID=A0A4R6BLN6_9STAP|nr:hypothetical protein [Macrococcus hajekii]TDM02537.1 hypothetical protein ERX37_00120 [Macrococcus hajekii]